MESGHKVKASDGENLQRAKREHNCVACGLPIRAGSFYKRLTLPGVVGLKVHPRAKAVGVPGPGCPTGCEQ